MGQFDEQSIKRIVRSVLRTEQLPRNETKWPRYWTRRYMGGRNTSSNLTSFGVVREEAGASSHSTDGLAQGSAGLAELLDENGGVSGEFVEFVSAHRVACTVGTIVTLHTIDDTNVGTGTGTGTDGTDTGNLYWGQYVDPVDYLILLDGADHRTSLVIPDAGEGTGDPTATEIMWEGVLCDTGTGTGT